MHQLAMATGMNLFGSSCKTWIEAVVEADL